MWPTPDAGIFNDSEDAESWETRRDAEKLKGMNGNGMGTPLAMAVRLWPTPTSGDSGDSGDSGAAGYSTESGRHTGTTLTDAAARGIWATPTASDADRGPTSTQNGGTLPNQVERKWATPTAQDEKGPGPAHMKGGVDLPQQIATTMGGKLNPDWVETLQGLPVGWTRCMMVPQKIDPPRNCAHCGAMLTRKRFNGRLEDRGVFLRRKHCGEACSSIASRSATPSRSALYKHSAKLRKSACEDCGSTGDLDLHHVDENPTNNDPQNLMTLCDACHTRWHWRHGKTIPKRSLSR